MFQFHSLRSKILLPLVITSIVVMVSVSLLVFREIHQQQSAVATKQAFLFANTLNQATASSSLLSSVRIVVNTMVRQERDIRAIAIATNDPFTVWASSIKDSPDKKTLNKRMLKSLFNASKKGEFVYRAYHDGHIEMTVPLDVLDIEIAEVETPNLMLSKWRRQVVEWANNQPFNVLDYFSENEKDLTTELTFEIPDLKSFRGVVFLRIDLGEQLQATKEMITNLAVIFLLGMGVAILFVAYLTQFFVITPTRKITQVMDAQASGQRNVRSNLRRADEIGKISQTFDHMMDNLDRTEQELKHHRDNLQELVNEKTAYLEIEKKRADEANAAKTQFLATMSHELRTPMTGVIGFTDILLSEDLSEQNIEYVKRIKNSAHALIYVVNDILDMSKLEAGKFDLELIDFDLPALLEEVADSFGARGQSARGISFEVAIADDLPKYVNSDPNRLRQILVNLLGNAFKFTAEGTVGLRAELRGEKDGAYVVRLSVQDTGIGIAPDVIKDLFDFFVQADASIARKFEGTGLGLAISKGLARLLGGDIFVESEVGKGSCFYIELPLESAHEDKVERSKSYTAADFQATRGLNILLAEDNKVNQLLIRKVLESYGHRIKVANDGLEAVELNTSEAFDVILMDVHMPQMDGMEATKAIRTHDDIPIIATTADAISDHIDQYISFGMNAYVSKPVDWAELVRTINKVTGEEIHILKAQG